MMHIAPVLTVTSLEAALPWYRDILGFEEVFVNRHDEAEEASAFYAVLSAETSFLHIGRDLEMEQIAGQSGFELTTDRFDEIHAAAKAHGASFYFDICLNPMGDENFALNDPDNNRIVVVRE
ncbi:MAG: VOC family protein [Pseudomonadota bacterium]